MKKKVKKKVVKKQPKAAENRPKAILVSKELEQAILEMSVAARNIRADISSTVCLSKEIARAAELINSLEQAAVVTASKEISFVTTELATLRGAIESYGRKLQWFGQRLGALEQREIP